MQRATRPCITPRGSCAKVLLALTCPAAGSRVVATWLLVLEGHGWLGPRGRTAPAGCHCIGEGEGASLATAISGGAAALCHFPGSLALHLVKRTRAGVVGYEREGRGRRESSLTDAHGRAARGLHRMALPDLLSLLPQAGCCPRRARQHPLLAGGMVERRDREEIRVLTDQQSKKNYRLGTGAFVVFVCFYLGGKGSYLREGNDSDDREFSFILTTPFLP